MAKTIPTGRLAEIERRILAAEAPGDFVPELAAKWNRTRRSVWTYVARVRTRLAERAKAADPDADRETVRAMVLTAYRTAQAGGESGPDAKGMVAATKLFAEVTGIVGPRRIELSGPAGAAIQHAVAARVVVLPPVTDATDAADPNAVVAEPGPAG